jgi:hypothetical protein
MARSTSYNFFATGGDILKVFHIVEALHQLQYVECGLFDESKRPVFQGFSSLPTLGLAQTGQSQLEPTFLVMLRGDKLNVRAVAQRRGGIKYAVDQQANPGTIMIRPGGMYNDSALIGGMVGTVHHDENAAKLMKAFSSALKKDFKKIKSYLVGAEAQKLQGSGVRLTHSVGAPAEFDLSA